MEKARCNTELYSNLRAPLNNVKPSNFWGSHHNGSLFFAPEMRGGVRGICPFGVRKCIFRHHFLWRGGFRCQKGYLSAPFLVAWWVSVSERVFFGTISCGEWVSVSERVSIGTVFCGEWGFGVRKAIFRHRKPGRRLFLCKNGAFPAQS